MTPNMNSVIAKDEPPAETKGNWSPVTGSSPMTYPMLIIAWPTIQVVAVADRSRQNGSMLRAAIRNHVYTNTANKPITTAQPTNSNSSPMIAKMKSLCAFGR